MTRRFPPEIIAQIDAARSLGVRSGGHRFTRVWVVVVEGRVLVRSWNDKPGGWFRAFLRQPLGAIRVGKREFPACGIRPRGKKLPAAVCDAFAARYPHKGSQRYVIGFREPRRMATTLELRPA